MKLWRVDDVMTRDVVTVREQTPYRDIVDLLISRRVSAVPVVDRTGKLTGLVSEADLLQKVEATAGRTASLVVSRRTDSAAWPHSSRAAANSMCGISLRCSGRARTIEYSPLRVDSRARRCSEDLTNAAMFGSEAMLSACSPVPMPRPA